jgi:hypothetical protein
VGTHSLLNVTVHLELSHLVTEDLLWRHRATGMEIGRRRFDLYHEGPRRWSAY